MIPPVQSEPGSLTEILAHHFDPEWGAPYWIEKRKSLGFDPLSDICIPEDLSLFGPFPDEDLRRGSARKFVPRRYLEDLRDFVVAETGGTTGIPARVYFSREEYRAGFIDPFLRVCGKVGWPRKAQWLYLGPSGPHIIGRVVETICRELDSPPPFRIDFDPRWSLRLMPGSVARTRYLEHLVDQSVNLMENEKIQVLFGTPPVLERLSERLSSRVRESVAAVHYGGTDLNRESYLRFRNELFPEAIHLSGYGNSLIGVAFEAGTGTDDMLRYYPPSPRHLIRLIPMTGTPDRAILRRNVPLGEKGRVVVSRIDPTCFLPNIVERDCAIRVECTPAARSLGWNAPGIQDPQPYPEKSPIKSGFY